MKKLIYILLAMYPLFFSSCEDYFEPEQTGLVEGDVFYKDLNNLRIGLNSVYNLMQSQQYQLSEIIFGEAMSDNSWNKQDVEVNEMGQLVNFQFNTENTYDLSPYLPFTDAELELLGSNQGYLIIGNEVIAPNNNTPNYKYTATNVNTRAGEFPYDPQWQALAGDVLGVTIKKGKYRVLRHFWW